jgi:ribosomal-protein-alanine N-acetyltransferase
VIGWVTAWAATQLSDAEAIYKILSDDQVMQYYDDETFSEIEQAQEQIESWGNGYKGRRCIRWGIMQKGDLNLIGTCGYYGIHTWHMRAGVGYELGCEYWRRGIMTEALKGIIDLGYRVMGPPQGTPRGCGVRISRNGAIMGSSLANPPRR